MCGVGSDWGQSAHDVRAVDALPTSDLLLSQAAGLRRFPAESSQGIEKREGQMEQVFSASAL